MKKVAVSLIVCAAAFSIAILLFYAALSATGVPRLGLLAASAVVALLFILVFFGGRVVVGLIGAIVSGAVLGGALWLTTLDNLAFTVIGCIVGYIAWLASSALLFGTPVIVIPFPPFFIFAWQKLGTEARRDALQRVAALVILAIAANVTINIHRRNVSPATTVATDKLGAMMHTQIEASLRNQGLTIRNLALEVDDLRSVTMTGVVEDQTSRIRAEDIVRRTPGVTRVNNLLEVE